MTSRQKIARQLAQYDATGAELRRLRTAIEVCVGQEFVIANALHQCETLSDDSWNALLASLSPGGKALVLEMCPTRASLSESEGTDK